MQKQCRFDFFKEAIPASLNAITDADLTVFFAMGIVNPFGPTLLYAAATTYEEVRNVYRVMLNPFSQQVTWIGTFSPGESCDLVSVTEHLAGGEMKNCPTLIFVNRNASEADRQRLYDKLTGRFSDAPEVFEAITGSLGEPWGRLSGKRSHRSRISSDIQEKSLVQLLQDGRHVWPELRVLIEAWDGSINQTNIPQSMKEEALPVEVFGSFLSAALAGVWLPDNPEEDPVRPAPSSAPQTPPESRDEIREKDMAVILAEEIESASLSVNQSVIPRVFAGITSDGYQDIYFLNGLPLDTRRTPDFLGWLCQQYDYVAYAYSAHMKDENWDDYLHIFGSSDQHNVEIMKRAIVGKDGGIRYEKGNKSVVLANEHISPYSQRHRKVPAFSADDEALFRNALAAVKADSYRRKR